MILGIDTTAKTCSVALVSQATLGVRTIHDGPTHSQTLLPFVKDLLEEASVSPEDLDVIAVSAGPGSFTGLRIGISAAKGLAFPFSTPCAPVSTLEALAMNLRDFEGAIACPVMDARRGEFYNALFRIENGVPVRITADRAIEGEFLKNELLCYDGVIVLGDGAEKFASFFPEYENKLASEGMRFQNGESVALVGMRLLKENKLTSCHALSPSYLRIPQAEREWRAKNKD